MHRRLQVLGLSAAAVAVLGIGALTDRGVFAQEATPPATTETPASSADASSAYDEFVEGLAANLGIADAATVDTAIKETLKQRVDEELAAGNIAANAATALKERIDAGEFGGPFFFGHGGDRHGGPFGGHGEPGERGWDKDGRDDAAEEKPAATTSAVA